MTDGGTFNNRKGKVLSLPKTWRLHDIGVRDCQMMVQRGDKKEVVPGKQFLFCYRDRESSVLTVNKPDQHSQNVQFAIPRGATIDEVAAILEQMVKQTREHFEPEPPEAA